MFIKYLNNIHNINNYNSVAKGGTYNMSIHLEKNDEKYHSLNFKDREARDYILSEIWIELIKKTEFYDIDQALEIYYDRQKYNL